MPKYTARAATTLLNMNNIKVDELVLTDYDSSLGKVFNAGSLADLYSAITGDTGSTLQDVRSSLGSNDVNYGLTSSAANGAVPTIPAYISAYDLYTIKNPITQQPRNQNILVDFGGQTWTVTFVTTDLNGDVVATLWLADAYKEGNDYVRSPYSWYSNTTKYSSGNATVTDYVSNMYSTSYIRVETLNGGDPDGGDTMYAWNNTATATTGTLSQTVPASDRLASPWAKFTLNNSALAGSAKANQSLIAYLDTPSQLKYTYYEDYSYQYGTLGGHGNNNYQLNEAISKDITGLVTGTKDANTISASTGSTVWYGAQMAGVAYTDYSNTDYSYNSWADDYLWLPSLTETGYVGSSGFPGIWQTAYSNNDQTGQLSIMGGSASTINWSTTNQTAIDGKDFVWLRTGFNTDNCFSSYMAAGGDYLIAFTARTFGVRPALHLNLTKADAASVTILTSPNKATVKAEYNGLSQTYNAAASGLAWYDSSIYTNPAAMSATYSSATVKDAGTYTVTLTLQSSDYVWSDRATDSSLSREITFIIEKKKLSITFIDDSDGNKVASFSDPTNEICFGDSTPTLVTKYYKSTESANNLKDSPDSAGAWVAVAVITDVNSNYCVDETEPFTVPIRQVTCPSITGDDSKSYNGAAQTFTVYGYDSDLMNYSITGATFDGTYITATDAGEYTLSFALQNTNLYAWATTPSSVTATIKPYAVIISVDDEDIPDPWTIEKGNSYDITVNAASRFGDALEVYAVYENDSGQQIQLDSVNNNDGTHTVTIPDTLSRGSYKLIVQISANTPNYVARDDIEMDFEITAQGLDLEESDLVWKIGSKKYYYTDLINGVLEIEYTGSAIAPSLDTSQTWFNDYSIAGYGGDISKTDVGVYTMTVSLEAYDPTEYFYNETFTLTYKIVPKVLDFTNVEWEWQYAGDSSWTAFSSGKPAFEDKAVDVRISKAYLASLGLADSDYKDNYFNNDNLTEQGDKSTKGEITITNTNFTTADGTGYFTTDYEWEITAKALSYTWGTGTLVVDGKAYDIPEVVFADGKDYSDYYEYVYTVNGEPDDFTKDELIDYISDNLKDDTTINGTVTIKLLGGVTEVNIISSSRPFTTGTPKTPITVNVTGSGSEYGKVQFGYTALRDGKDERERTEVTVSGDTIEAQTFDGTSSELAAFVNGLNAGSYVITLTLTGNNGDSYALSQYSFAFEIEKCRVELPTVPEIIYNGDVQLLEKLLIGYNSNIMELGGITSQSQHGTYTATVSLKDTDNYIFVKTTVTDGNVPVKLVLTDETESVETIGGESELSWTIEKFVITQDMWDMSGKKGASIKLPSEFNALLGDEKVLKITYDYYTEQNGEPLANPDFKGGTSFYVAATLSGSEADNFVFENGELTSEKTVYTVPQNAFSKFMNNTLDFVKNNLALIIGCAVGLLLLILLIIIIAVASKKKKKREAELKEEKKLEREERMMRMQMGGMPMGGQMPITAAGMIAQQQMPAQSMPMPVQQQMPMQQFSAQDSSAILRLEMEMAEVRAKLANSQFAPATAPAPQPTAAPAGDSTTLARLEAQLNAMQAEQRVRYEAEQHAEQNLKTEIALKTELEMMKLRLDQRQPTASLQTAQTAGVASDSEMEKIVAVATAVWRNMQAQQNAEVKPAPAEESKQQYPSDAVITTTTTVDTTKNKPIARSRNEGREERGEFTDVDGFYDKYE